MFLNSLSRHKLTTTPEHLSNTVCGCSAGVPARGRRGPVRDGAAPAAVGLRARVGQPRAPRGVRGPAARALRRPLPSAPRQLPGAHGSLY